MPRPKRPYCLPSQKVNAEKYSILESSSSSRRRARGVAVGSSIKNAHSSIIKVCALMLDKLQLSFCLKDLLQLWCENVLCFGGCHAYKTDSETDCQTAIQTVRQSDIQSDVSNSLAAGIFLWKFTAKNLHCFTHCLTGQNIRQTKTHSILFSAFFGSSSY